MPRATRLVVLALAAVLLALGPAQTAGASDAGLRELVARTAATRDRVDRDLRSVESIPTTSAAAAVRRLRRAARIHDRVRRTVTDLRGAFVAEPAQTPLADEGRGRVLDGLQDLRGALTRLARADRVAAGRLSRARSEAAVRSAARAYERVRRSSARRTERGYERVERGGRLIAIAR